MMSEQSGGSRGQCRVILLGLWSYIVNKCTLGKLMMRTASKGHFFTQMPQPLEASVRIKGRESCDVNGSAMMMVFSFTEEETLGLNMTGRVRVSAHAKRLRDHCQLGRHFNFNTLQGG